MCSTTWEGMYLQTLPTHYALLGATLLRMTQIIFSGVGIRKNDSPVIHLVFGLMTRLLWYHLVLTSMLPRIALCSQWSRSYCVLTRGPANHPTHSVCVLFCWNNFCPRIVMSCLESPPVRVVAPHKLWTQSQWGVYIYVCRWEFKVLPRNIVRLSWRA